VTSVTPRPPRAAVAPLTDTDTPARPSDETPPAIAAYLDGVESRLATADRLAGATSVSEATDAVAAVGGPEDVTALRDQLQTDRETLRTLADRCSRLADQAEAVEIPVETLARLA